MSELVVEVHVPLIPAQGVTATEYQFPWIDTVMDYLFALDGEQGDIYDDGEELGDEYLFFISGATESELMSRSSPRETTLQWTGHPHRRRAGQL